MKKDVLPEDSVLFPVSERDCVCLGKEEVWLERAPQVERKGEWLFKEGATGVEAVKAEVEQRLVR